MDLRAEGLASGRVHRADRLDDEAVYVDRSKDEIKGSPELTEGSTWADPTYRESVGTYYGSSYSGRPGL